MIGTDSLPRHSYARPLGLKYLVSESKVTERRNPVEKNKQTVYEEKKDATCETSQNVRELVKTQALQTAGGINK